MFFKMEEREGAAKSLNEPNQGTYYFNFFFLQGQKERAISNDRVRGTSKCTHGLS